MKTLTTQFNTATKTTTELKGLYCILFNKLNMPYLSQHEKDQILATINQVTAELQLRRVM